MHSGRTVWLISGLLAFASGVAACDVIDPGGPQIAKPGLVHRPPELQAPPVVGMGLRLSPVPAQMRTRAPGDVAPATGALLPDVDAPTVASPEIEAMRRRAEERARALERTFEEIKRRIDEENGVLPR